MPQPLSSAFSFFNSLSKQTKFSQTNFHAYFPGTPDPVISLMRPEIVALKMYSLPQTIHLQAKKNKSISL